MTKPRATKLRATKPRAAGWGRSGADSLPVEVDGRRVEVALKRNASARRMVLRVDLATGAARLTLPPRARLADARRFVEAERGWIAERLRNRPAAQPFDPGAVIPLRGADVRIVHDPDIGRKPALDSGELRVGGPPAHVAARVERYLRAEAAADLKARVAVHAAAVGRRAGAITLRDPATRWGSCAASGRLSFSWRLILAPPSVLDYVAAHEVAHLREMNHSDRFWAIVEALRPDWRDARDWLRVHGGALRVWGRRDLGGRRESGSGERQE